MDEYIKREDALDTVLFALVGTGLQSTAIYALRDVPTADVVPKTEVERLENTYSRAVRKANKNAITAIQNAKQKVAREIFEEIDKLHIHVSSIYDANRYAELKKKYTEGKDE